MVIAVEFLVSLLLIPFFEQSSFLKAVVVDILLLQVACRTNWPTELAVA